MSYKSRNKRQALFITVEGLEGSGKSSVIKYIYGLLKEKKFKVNVYREPGSTKIGEKIRKILLDNKNKKLSSHTELLLYLASRTQLIEEKIKIDMKRYDFIICDRFFDSTLVYQGVALNLGKITEEAVKLFSLGVSPDLTFFLDTPVEDGLARLTTKDRIESRPLDFHKRLRVGYLRIAKKYPKRVIKVNAKGNLPEIYKRVKVLLDDFIVRKLKQGNIDKL